MTDEHESVELPMELAAESGAIVSGIVTIVVGALIGAAILALCVVQALQDGFAKAFADSWLVLLIVLLIPLGAVLHGLHQIWARKLYTVTTDEVRARMRRWRRWRTWAEPLANYRGVEVRVEHHDPGQGSARKVYTVTIMHRNDWSKNVELRHWTWSHSRVTSTEECRASAEAYCRLVATALGLPDDGCEES